MCRVDWWNDHITKFSIYHLASYWKFHESFMASQWQSRRFRKPKIIKHELEKHFWRSRTQIRILGVPWRLVPTRHHEKETPWFIAIKQNRSPMTNTKFFWSNSVRSQCHMDKRVKKALMGQLTMMVRGRRLPLRGPRWCLKSHHHLKKFEKAKQSKKKKKKRIPKKKIRVLFY